MKKYIKWGAICLTIIIVIFIVGAIAYVLAKPKVSKHIEPTPEEQAIIDQKFNSKDAIDMKDLSSVDGVVGMIHSMANTKIISDDGQYWGLLPITKQRVEALQKAVISLKINDPKINNILDRWSKQDFSKCVDEHNYIWNDYLHGTEGKAVSLRQ